MITHGLCKFVIHRPLPSAQPVSSFLSIPHIPSLLVTSHVLLGSDRRFSSLTKETCSQRRSGLHTTLLAKRLAHQVGSVTLWATSRKQILALLALAHLLLHGNHLLLLGPAQGKGDTEQQGRNRNRPHGAAGKEDDARHDAARRRVLAVEPGAGCGWDNVLEGRQAVRKGLDRGVKVGVVGDFGVCGMMRCVSCLVCFEIGNFLIFAARLDTLLMGSMVGKGEDEAMRCEVVHFASAFLKVLQWRHLEAHSNPSNHKDE